jgi:hypothetical protein
MLVEEVEGTGMRNNAEPHSVSVYQDAHDSMRHTVATFHLAAGEWVARVDTVSQAKGIS